MRYQWLSLILPPLYCHVILNLNFFFFCNSSSENPSFQIPSCACSRNPASNHSRNNSKQPHGEASANVSFSLSSTHDHAWPWLVTLPSFIPVLYILNIMVFLHPDAPLKCTQCSIKQLTVTFNKNPKSTTFEQSDFDDKPNPSRATPGTPGPSTTAAAAVSHGGVLEVVVSPHRGPAVSFVINLTHTGSELKDPVWWALPHSSHWSAIALCICACVYSCLFGLCLMTITDLCPQVDTLHTPLLLSSASDNT